MTNHPRWTMAERNLCSAIFVCALSVLWSPLLHAQSAVGEPPSLPNPDDLTHITTTLAGFDPATLAEELATGRAEVRDCVVGQAMTCTSLSWRRDGLSITATRWTHERGQSVWAGLSVEYGDGSRMAARSWRGTETGATVEQLRWLRANRAELAVARASIDMAETSDETSIYLDELTWVAGADDAADPVMSARWARHDDNEWRIHGARITPSGPTLGGVEGATPRIESGFLPPTLVHGGGDVTEIEAIALRSTSGPTRGVGGYLRGTWSHWYGMGLALVGHHGPNEYGISFDDTRPLATVGLVWEPGRRPAVAAEGLAVFGDPLTHTALDLESPGYTDAWRTQSVRRGAFFRDWSLTSGGIALHGRHHALRASAWGAQTYSGLDAGRANGIRAGFGTEHRFGERVDVALEVAHDSTSSSTRDRHVSSIRSDVAIGFGQTDRAYARLSGLGRVRTRLVPTAVGFGAGTSGGLYTAAEGGLAVAGRFDGLTHHLHPSVFAISEVVDFEKTAQDAINDGLDATVGTGLAEEVSTPWHSAGLRLGQRFNTGAWTVDMPLEVFVSTYGPPGPFADILGGSAGATASYVTSDGVGFSGDGNVVCERACRSVAWDIGAQLEMGRWDAGVRVARANRLSQRVADLRATADTWSRILAFELPASAVRVSQTARVGWERHRFRVDALAVTDFEGWGASLEPHWRFPSLGWSVGLTGFYDGFTGDWGLLAGLRGR